MIMCVLLLYPVSIHMLQLLSAGRPISSIDKKFKLPSVVTIALQSTLSCWVSNQDSLKLV